MNNVRDSFDKVSYSIDNTTANIESIYIKTNELVSVKDDVMVEVSNLSSIAEGNAASCEETSAVIENINSTIDTINIIKEFT